MALISGILASFALRPAASASGRPPAPNAAPPASHQAVQPVHLVGADLPVLGQMLHAYGAKPQACNARQGNHDAPAGVVLDDIPYVNDAAILSDDLVKPQPPLPVSPALSAVAKPVPPAPPEPCGNNPRPSASDNPRESAAATKPLHSEAWEESLRILRPQSDPAQYEPEETAPE